MTVIVVANPKGGVGKSTVATQVAGWLAQQGEPVMLGDIDRQHSSRMWLGLRPPTLPPVRAWELVDREVVRPPKGTRHVVLDTPAGLHGKRLEAVLKVADRLIVPLQVGPFDLAATLDFLHLLAAHPHARDLPVALVAVRVKEHTHAMAHLEQALHAQGHRLLARLRDTQNYTHLAARGLTLFDLAPGRIERDLQQWQPILDWLSPVTVAHRKPA